MVNSIPGSSLSFKIFSNFFGATCHSLNLNSNSFVALASIHTGVPGLACLISSVPPSKVAFAVPSPTTFIVIVYFVGCGGCCAGIVTSIFALL